MKTYHNEYELLIDLPTGEKKGDHFFFHNEESKIWYQVGKLSSYSTRENTWYKNCNANGSKIPLKGMTSDFFKPIGEARPLYPPFPSKKKIKEYYNIIGDPCLVDSVDEVRAINEVFYSEEYYNACYETLKKMYNLKFNQK